MARLLVQLKLRLLLNALRSSNSAKISFIISSAFAVLLAIFTFILLAGFRGKSTSVELTSVIFTVFAFGWLIAPILVFGVDSTLVPRRLRCTRCARGRSRPACWLRCLPGSGRLPTSSACSA